MSNRYDPTDPAVDTARRMKRLETRVTSFMRYHGFWPGRDLDLELAERVLLDRERGEVHVTSPNVPIGNVLDAVITAEMGGAVLYVSGVRAGYIDPRRSTE